MLKTILPYVYLMIKNVFKNEKKKTVLLAQEVNSNKIDVCCPQKK